MKYIRTKDGEIFVEQTELNYSGITYYKSKQYTNRFLLNETLDTFFCRFGGIKKQADTIEELCDEYVLYNPNIDFKYYLVELLRYENDNGGIAIYYKFKNSQQEFSLFSSRETIYGAIWTDKGLIYVAKMNDKGELELI